MSAFSPSYIMIRFIRSLLGTGMAIAMLVAVNPPLAEAQALPASRQFNTAWEIRAFINSIAGVTHIRDYDPYSGAARNEQTTALGVCELAGYGKATRLAGSGYSSCGDNTIGYWDPNKANANRPSGKGDFTVYGACNYNAFITVLRCEEPIKKACEDGVDNDGDGLIDIADPGCTSATDNDEKNAGGPQCDDGVDNDADGKIDYKVDGTGDPQCTSPSGPSENIPACRDGVDNDGDGLIDEAQDPGCSSPDDATETNPTGPQCDNGLDDDSDGKIDYKANGSGDPDCVSPTDTVEGAIPACSDGIDNDGDGRTDMEDPGCINPTDTTETNPTGPQCDNGIDDDGDGKKDYRANGTGDPQCVSPTDTSEGGNPSCSDGIDNDGDGLTDLTDPGCSGPTDTTETNPNGAQCDNGIDDDSDGKTDYRANGTGDPDCTGVADTTEAGTTTGIQCQNGVDDDGDGLVDMADPGCSTPTDTTETNPSGAQCDNGIDDDFDGKTDFKQNGTGDPDCTSPTDPTEVGTTTGTQCNNGIDDDGDGLIDLNDFGCSGPTDPTETNPNGAQCDNGIDDDGDGRTDFKINGTGDLQCVSSTDTNEGPDGTTGEVTIDLTDSVDPVEPGETFTYTIRITNLGSATVIRDEVTLSLDPDIEFVSATSGGSQSNGIVRWTNIAVPGSSSTTITALVRVKSSADEGDILRSTAFTNPSDTETTLVGDGSGNGDEDLKITIEESSDPVAPGDTITYTIRIENRGDDDVEIDVEAVLDPDMEFLDANEDGDEEDDDIIRWEDIEIDEDDEIELTLEVEVDEDADDGDRIKLLVRAGTEEETEFTRIDEDAVASTNGGLTVDKRADRTEVQPGNLLSYTVTVRNDTSGTIRDIEVEDTFTAGSLTIQDTGGGQTMGNGLRWTIDSLGAGQTRILQYSVRVGTGMRHGQVIGNSISVRGGSRNGNDFSEVRVIEQLPQTGGSSFAAAMNGMSGLLKKSTVENTTSGDATGGMGGMIAWSVMALAGVGMGGLGARRFLA